MIHPTRLLSAAALTLCLSAPAASRAQAPAPSPGQPVYVVALVDFIPDFQEKGLGLLRDYAAEARHAPGAIRFEVVREIFPPNHFTLLEAWDNEASRQAYEYGVRTKQFRADIQPLIGSPFTERLGHLEKP